MVEVHREVEGGLSPHGWQQRRGTLALDHPLDPLRGERLNIGPIREVRIGHDGGGIRVHQDDAIPILTEGSHGLGSGIVELTGLTDNDWAGAEYENAL